MSSAGDGIEPGKLWSLWGIMNLFRAQDGYEIIGRMTTAVEQSRAFGIEPVPDARLSAIRDGVLKHAIDIANAAGLVETEAMANRLFKLFGTPATHDRITNSIADLVDLMRSEMERQLFFVMPEQDRDFYTADRLFGETVFDAFPSAAMDIKEAGMCFSFERYNAAVYHAITAAEVGLRVLAKDRRTEPKLFKKVVALDQAQWGTLVGALETKIREIQSWKAGAAKDAAHQFYQPALLEASALNDGWRRHIMHAKGKPYEREEARSVLGHSERFLQRLATRLGERKKITPAIWKRV